MKCKIQASDPLEMIEKVQSLVHLLAWSWDGNEEQDPERLKHGKVVLLQLIDGGLDHIKDQWTGKMSKEAGKGSYEWGR